MHNTTTKKMNKPWNYKSSDVNLTNPIALIEQGKEALGMYYETIGQEYNADERHFRHSQPRMALGMALTNHLGDTLTADILGKDRTTIIHYRRNHEANLKAWDGYSTFFETAEYIVNTYFDGMAKVNRINYIDKIINRLLQEKISIQSKINVKLQVQDD
jgi:hypothetical protein